MAQKMVYAALSPCVGVLCGTLLLATPSFIRLAMPASVSTTELAAAKEGEPELIGINAGTMQPKVAGLLRDDKGRWRLAKDENGYVSEGELITVPQDLRAAKEVSVHWIEQWTSPLRFEKFKDNPVYGPRQSGVWDDWTNGVSIVPTNNGKTYRMYYADRKNGIGFAEADASTPTVWKENPASPVFVPRKDNWEGGQINQPRVVKVTETHWRMYYTGWGFPGPGLPAAPGTPWALGLAESFDGGTTWKRYQDDPILARGAQDSPDGGAAVVPMVIRVGDQRMMWYTAARGNVTPARDVHLCLATSSDGIHWEKYAENPVLADPVPDKHTFASRCYVRFDDGVFRMWYSYSEGKPSYRIRYAESLDGIHWERAPIAPVLDASPAPSWDDARVEYPEVQVVDGRFRLWFCGNTFGSVGYATGVPETGVQIFIRSGDKLTAGFVPDSSWTAWSLVQRDRPIAARRYVQVRAVLWSKNSQLSPALNSVTVRAAPAHRVQ